MNTNNIAITISGSGKITAVIEGQVHTIDNTHPSYDKALQCVKESNWQGFLEAVDLTSKVKNYIHNSELKIDGGVIIYKDEVIHNTLTKRIMRFMSNELPVVPLVKFLENLLDNPSKRAVDELYDFLEAGELPITEDGCFLAYKNVKADYTDIHSGTFDNSVGKVCEMLRNKVDEDKDRTCSYGLHFCSIKYLPHFSDSNGGHTMIVKINPKDVVAIPADYNNTKGRCCRYEVVAEYKDDWRSKLDRGESGWDFDLYDENGDEYDEEENCESCGTTLDNYDEDENLCNSCAKDDDESEDFDCKDWDKHQSQFVGNPDVVGNEGNDGCCGGQCGCDNHNNQYGVKPNGDKFHNVRDDKGRFVKKSPEQESLIQKVKDFLNNL
jgi:hypothetical protein